MSAQPFIFCGNENVHEPHDVTHGNRECWCPGMDAAADARIVAWWAQNYWRQIARLHEAYLALGIKEPVNYTGEVTNVRAVAAEREATHLREQNARLQERLMSLGGPDQ